MRSILDFLITPQLPPIVTLFFGMPSKIVSDQNFTTFQEIRSTEIWPVVSWWTENLALQFQLIQKVWFLRTEKIWDYSVTWRFRCGQRSKRESAALFTIQGNAESNTVRIIPFVAMCALGEFGMRLRLGPYWVGGFIIHFDTMVRNFHFSLMEINRLTQVYPEIWNGLMWLTRTSALEKSSILQAL